MLGLNHHRLSLRLAETRLDGRLNRPHGDGPVGRYPVGHGHCLCQQFAGGNDTIYEAEFVRTLRVYKCSCEQPLHRDGIGELCRQSNGGAATGEERPTYLLHTEAGSVRCDPNIGPLHELTATCDCGTVYRSDDGLVEVADSQNRTITEVGFCQIAPVVVIRRFAAASDQLDRLCEIGSRTEDLPRAGHDGDPNGVVLRNLLLGVGQPTSNFGAQSVAVLGAVQCDEGGMALAFILDGGHRGNVAEPSATVSCRATFPSCARG